MPAPRLLRNPYFWGAVVGVALVTLIRPRLRRVPKPPPVTQTMPAFRLQDQRGHTVSPASLAGQVYVGCFGKTQALGEMLRILQRRFVEQRAAIRLLSFHGAALDEARQAATLYKADPERWSVLAGPGVHGLHDALRPTLGTLVSPRPKVPAERCLIVDEQGRTRGAYPTDGLGQDEIFHRAQHVLQQARSGAKKRLL